MLAIKATMTAVNIILMLILAYSATTRRDGGGDKAMTATVICWAAANTALIWW